jgi:hypothetical protein
MQNPFPFSLDRSALMRPDVSELAARGTGRV